MYMILRLRMSLIMDLIGPELNELSALEFEFAIFDFVYFLSSTNIDKSVPNLATIYIAIKSQMSLIMGQIESENLETKMYVTKRLQMSSNMDLILPELSELSALEFENFPYLTLFTLYHLQILTKY